MPKRFRKGPGVGRKYKSTRNARKRNSERNCQDPIEQIEKILVNNLTGFFNLFNLVLTVPFAVAFPMTLSLFISASNTETFPKPFCHV